MFEPHYNAQQDHPPQPPRRVVSLVPSMTETLFDLNLGQFVVGITDDCLFPATARVRRVGAMDAIRVDEVQQLMPDLVIVNLEENTYTDILALESAGLQVWRTFPRTVREGLNFVWDVLNLFVVEDRMMYERVNLIERSLDWVGGVARAYEHIPCPVFVPILKNPLTTFSHDTYTHDLLQVVGAQNIFAHHYDPTPNQSAWQDVARLPIVTLDEVIQAQPQIVLLPTYPDAFTEEDVAFYSRLPIPAAEMQQVYLIDGTLLLYHGTRMAKALNHLSALMCFNERIPTNHD